MIDNPFYAPNINDFIEDPVMADYQGQEVDVLNESSHDQFSVSNLVDDAMNQLAEIKTTGDLLKSALIRPTDEIAPPDRLITYQDKVIGSLGDFSLLIGKAKSRKSLLTSLFVAAFLSRHGLNGLEVKSYPNKTRMVIFDTEQSRYHSQRGLKRAIRKAGMAAEDAINVELYCLRPFSPAERVELITEVIVTRNVNNDIALVIIDGIRDLITDINSPEQATGIATSLMKWTENKHLHLITVLHQNKGDSNARGHVGTELVNKAQTVISVEIAKGGKEFSNVNPEQTREEPFEPFSICFDSEGLPCMGEVVEEEKGESKRAMGPYDFELSVHEGLCRGIFEKNSSFSYKELVEKICLAFGKLGYPTGDNKAKKILSHWMDEEFICNNKVAGSKTSNYQRVKP